MMIGGAEENDAKDASVGSAPALKPTAKRRPGSRSDRSDDFGKLQWVAGWHWGKQIHGKSSRLVLVCINNRRLYCGKKLQKRTPVDMMMPVEPLDDLSIEQVRQKM